MYTDIKPTYQVTLNADEYRLVTMALAGLIKDKADREAALKLNVHMCQQRVRHTAELANTANKTYEHAVKLAQNENVAVPEGK